MFGSYSDAVGGILFNVYMYVYPIICMHAYITYSIGSHLVVVFTPWNTVLKWFLLAVGSVCAGVSVCLFILSV